MERDEPSEQPCREGEELPTPGNPTITKLSGHSEQEVLATMVLSILPPLVLTSDIQVNASMTLTSVPAIFMGSEIVTSATMTMVGGACIPVSEGAVYAVDDFSSWRHCDGESVYPASGFGNTDTTFMTDNVGSFNARGWFVPFPITRDEDLTSVTLYVNSLSDAGRKAKILIYNSKPRPDNYPDSLIANGSDLSGDILLDGSTGPKTQSFLGTTLTAPGIYWVGLLVNGGVGSSFRSIVQPIQSTAIIGRPQLGAFPPDSYPTQHIRADFNSFAFPSVTFPAGAVEIPQQFSTSTTPALYIKYAT